MLRSTACPKCQGSMSEGVIVDQGHGTYSISSWHPGPAQVSRWFGLKVKSKALVPTIAYRCGRCGFIEQYAPPVTG